MITLIISDLDPHRMHLERLQNSAIMIWGLSPSSHAQLNFLYWILYINQKIQFLLWTLIHLEWINVQGSLPTAQHKYTGTSLWHWFWDPEWTVNVVGSTIWNSLPHTVMPCSPCSTISILSRNNLRHVCLPQPAPLIELSSMHLWFDDLHLFVLEYVCYHQTSAL